MKNPFVSLPPQLHDSRFAFSRARLWGALALCALTHCAFAAGFGGAGRVDRNCARSIKAQLQAFKVVLEKDGDEKLASADVANPGDVIEYRATYSNDGKRAATNLSATLPIPAALSYVPNTASPGGFLASTDARNFAPAPLKRAAKDKDGKTVMVMVPFSEYRALRWNVSQLAPGADFKVSARASVRERAAVKLEVGS